MEDGETTIIVGQTISVNVEEFLPDLILVSFKYNNKIFQGILLDSTKRQLPCGIDAKKFIQSNEDNHKEDKLYSVKQRHTYFQNSDIEIAKNQNQSLKKTSSVRKPKNSRMTVRLRPRQVLCNNCQSICNENLESVGSSKGLKPPPVSNNNNNGISTEVSILSNSSGKKFRESRSSRETRQHIMCNSVSGSVKENGKTIINSQVSSPVLVPKLIKLKASDIETATSVGISSLPNDNTGSKPIQSQATLSVCTTSDNYDYTDVDGKLCRLRLMSGLSSRKNKGKIPKMTISTSTLPSLSNGEGSKECGIRTRSRGSLDDKLDEIACNKPVATKMASFLESSEKNDNDSIRLGTIPECDEKQTDCEQKSDTQPKLNTTAVSSTASGDEGSNYNLPKLTILPLNSKATENVADNKVKGDKLEKMNLRKKRSVGSMEDLWDETIFDDTKKLKSDNGKEVVAHASSEDCEGSTDSDKPKTTPILKISFGPGKGTVLKIPAKSTISENDSTESEEQSEVMKKNKNVITKAARKALKRAKKEAQRKAMVGTSSSVLINKSRFGGKSPMRLGGMSPARLSGFSPGRFGGTSPGRFGGASPGRFGGTSPARFGGSSPSIFGGMMSPRTNVEGFFRTQTRKHKHKVKHKKKHKEDRKHKSDENVEPNNAPLETPVNKEDAGPLTETTNMDVVAEKTLNNVWKVPSSPDQPLSNAATNASSPKQNILQNTRHKLSISIKRVSNASYVTCDPNDQAAKKEEIDPSTLQVVSEELSPKRTLTSLDENNTLSSPDHSTLNTKPSYEENDYNYLNITPEREIGSDPNLSNDEIGDVVPDFPCVVNGGLEQEEDAGLLLMKFGWHDVEACEVPEGPFKVGDVVWGKVNDLPWWPAKINRLKVSNDSCRGHQAQVCWYGTQASSLLPMESLQPFLKKFNVRYRTRKEGPYQDAVREANSEADQIWNDDDDDETPLTICESPITASPREVDVAS